MCVWSGPSTTFSKRRSTATAAKMLYYDQSNTKDPYTRISSRASNRSAAEQAAFPFHTYILWFDSLVF